PGHALGSQPHDPRVIRLKPGEPGEGFLHVADRLGRGRNAWHARSLPPESFIDASDDRRPRVEISRHAAFGETAQRERGFLETFLDHRWRPARLAHAGSPR